MKALILAGGLPQIELLNNLKKRGITTVLADGSDGCIARPYADIFYRTQIFDVEAVADIARQEQVDFVITVCADQVLLVVAQVSELLGLPCYIDYQTAVNVSDKLLMKSIFAKHDIPTSRFLRTEEYDESALSKLCFPLIVKPVDAYSSKGVRRAENFEELRTYYAEARDISRSGGVIVEEYRAGEEISVDAFVIDGKAELLLVSNSDKFLDEQRFVIHRGKTPANVSPFILEQIREVAQKIADAFGLVNSPLLIQLINGGDSISVLEFCARTGGNAKYILIRNSCGVDVIDATVELFLRNKPTVHPEDSGKVVVNDFLYCRPGVFDRMEGFEELLREGVITEYHATRSSGTQTFGARSSSDRVGMFNIVASSVEEYNEKIRTVRERVSCLDPEGNDILRHDLLTEW